MVLMMGIEWIAKFRGLWAALLWRLVPVILVFGFLMLLTFLFGKLTSLTVRRVFRRKLDAAGEVRISQRVFVICAVLFIAAFFFAWAKLGGRTYTIKAPNWNIH